MPTTTMRRLPGPVAVIGLLALLLLMPATSLGKSGKAAPARVAHGPSLSWTLPGSATAGSPLAMSWTASHLRPGSQLVVQRQEGTARSWHTIARLSGSSGAANVPGLPIGRYRLRLAGLGKHRVVLGQLQRIVKVFGPVPLTTLFGLQHENGGAYFAGEPSAGVYTAPDRTFPYAMQLFANETAPFTFATVANNTCRAVHLDVVVGEADPNRPGVSATVSVIQEMLDPARATAGQQSLVTLDTPLVPGTSWSLTTVGSSANFGGVYVNGYATCFSTEALRA